MTPCPCNSNRSFAECCEPLLQGELAASPEALMRSRYTAYATKNMQYVVDTTDPQAVLSLDLEASEEWADNAEFFKLEVLRSSDEGNKGTVEFKAHFRFKGGEAQVHHEIAKFRKQAGRWYFRDGRVVTAEPPP